MPAERGDSRPCIRSGCDGMMQFGRKPVFRGSGVGMMTAGARGWNCSVTPEHFSAQHEATGEERPTRGARIAAVLPAG